MTTGPHETSGFIRAATTELHLGAALPVDVVALGGELKNTVCVATGDRAWLSEPHGDLGEAAAYRAFVKTVDMVRSDLPGDDYVIAHDLHPTYASTLYARNLPHPKVAVQHHHAHGVSCAVDAGVALPVIGVVCDGTGYGSDGAIWGGEVLLCRADSFERIGHLDYFRLPGGDAAARATWRPAMSLLREAFPDTWQSLDLPALGRIHPKERTLVERQLDVELNAPNTSSLGRLFDAVAFLTDICAWNEREGQAAIALQQAAGDGSGSVYAFRSIPFEGSSRLDWRPMIRRIVSDARAGVDVAVISARFHETIAAMFASAVETAMRTFSVDRVALSGGCFLNDRLRGALTARLTGLGASVAVHQRVSTGDAGLSLGQAVIASAVAAKRRV